MESSKVGYWLQVGANIGILIGLVLVGLQINQAADLLKLQLVYEDEGLVIENESALLGDDPTKVIQKAMDSPHELTFGEMRLLEAYHFRPYAQLERRYNARDLLGDDWKDDVYGVAWSYGTPIGRAWWDVIRDIAPPEIRRLLDDALADQTSNLQRDQFDRIKANLAKYLDAE